jgi:ribose transport system substrate-binding protein
MQRARCRQRRQWAIGLVALAVVIAGCGSSSSSSSSSSAATSASTTSAGTATSGASSSVASTIAEFSGPVKWPGPNTSVKPPTGKTITIIICGSQGITCVRVGNGAKAAAAALGYKATVVDGQSEPTVWNQAIRSAVASKTSGIILAGVPPALVTGALAVAKSAGIPVATVLSVLGPATDVRVTYDRAKVAQANSAFIAKNSGGNAKVLVVRDDEFPETKPTMDGYTTDLPKACSGCSVVKTINFTLALASSRLAGDVTQALQSNPSINYIVVPFDAVETFLSQGIRQAGMTGKVHIVGVGADPPSVQGIKAGDEVESLGTPAEWMGWDAMDGLVRVFAKKAVPALDASLPGGASNYQVPERIITKSNLPGASGWQGSYNYQAKFKQLWGK